MKISPAHLLATLFIAEIQAQSLPPNSCAAVAATAVPKCAQSCFINNAPSVGCGGLDFACQCEKKASFFAAVEGCVGSSCQSSEFQKVIDGASSVCECAVGHETPQTVHSTVPSHIASSTPTQTPASTSIPSPTMGKPAGNTSISAADRNSWWIGSSLAGLAVACAFVAL